MTTFALAAAALAVATLLLLLRPWRRLSGAAAAVDAAKLNAAIYRDRLAELERDHANGALSADALSEARVELQRQLLEDAPQEVPLGDTTDAVTDAAPAAASSLKSTVVLSLSLLLAATILYALIGNRQALLTPEEANQQARQDMEQRITQLAKKMEQEPKTEGLVMLARSYKSLERWDDAVRSFERIGPELDSNAALLAEFAETLAQQSRSLDGRPRMLIQRALGIDPSTPLALFLAGSDALQNRRYDEAVGYWSKLLPQLEPEGEDARMVAGAIATAKERANASGARKATPAASGKSVSGHVELSAALKPKVKPTDVLYILARAVNGPRMPLAVVRAHVSDLPLKFNLDDSQAMSPELTISQAGEIRIEARISKTGLAVAGKGDLTGKSAVLKPGAKGVRIVIDEAVE
jgi:cytochrome c-type biogenesis protein CcmH